MGKWKTISISVAALLICLGARAQGVKQVQKDVEVGMEVTLMPCSASIFYRHIDLYTKTRYDSNKPPQIDSASGEGLYDYFFTPGDFDASRLPCTYASKKYKVAALHIFEEENGKEKRVMLLYTAEPLKLIWVEFDDAVLNEELTW
jgi:hypothetical protein